MAIFSRSDQNDPRPLRIWKATHATSLPLTKSLYDVSELTVRKVLYLHRFPVSLNRDAKRCITTLPTAAPG